MGSSRAQENLIETCFGFKNCGFKGNSVDPCLWTKYSNHGIVLFGIYVNDCLVIESNEGIDDVINGSRYTNLA